jgi:hypothetical protein
MARCRAYRCPPLAPDTRRSSAHRLGRSGTAPLHRLVRLAARFRRETDELVHPRFRPLPGESNRARGLFLILAIFPQPRGQTCGSRAQSF